MQRFFRVDVKHIGYLRFIIESYEGLAQLSSLPGRCEVAWVVPRDLVPDAERLARALDVEIGLVPIPRPQDWPASL